MKSFSGSSKTPKVSLGGRSRTQEESREEVLQRTRLEREKRRQAKAEQNAATTIQAHWRGWACAHGVRTQLRAAWSARWGQQGQHVDTAALSAGSP
eukprot:CAMPEP_0202878136 /NCGR_PEP_ID=MMETSP1391-20130828/31706_1 /ASSEMBLY_ACC=CAM_ASM_000867 /TAXON_ID=1034604 /ORGANISM="Chlamydomonas leiostraca, Strain SAG 11-49" /LENGTH=95 /DNA_ID=CAMNT_0049560281 /DNA_START=49 /DNA_END=333 /DNA_ORIENTATION=+